MKDDLGLFYFHQGTNYYAYKYLGSHILDGKTVFRVWAPNALKVSVVGDFNNWDRQKNPMNKISDGVWEIVIDGIVKEPLGGAHYDYEEMGKELKKDILNSIKEFKNMSAEELKADRYAKFRRMGVFNS
jgi:1,4-alpha-glucan branching enzyme